MSPCFQYVWVYLVVALLGHMEILCLSFWELAKLFFTVTAPFYIPTSKIQGFQVLYSLFNTWFLFFKIVAILVSHLNLVSGMKWYFIVVLICFSLMTKNVEQFFLCVHWPYVFFRDRSIQVLCSFLNWVVCCFVPQF